MLSATNNSMNLHEIDKEKPPAQINSPGAKQIKLKRPGPCNEE